MIRVSTTSRVGGFMPGLSGTLTLSRLLLFVMAVAHPRGLTLSRRMRVGACIASSAVSLAAAFAYVFAVNAMLVDGEAMRRDRVELELLEREQAALVELVAFHSSPSWLARRSQEAGMVNVVGLRYLSVDSSIALSSYYSSDPPSLEGGRSTP